VKDIVNRSGALLQGAQSADRLFNLLSSFSNLRRDNHALVGQIRGSINRLRELRLELSKRHPLEGSSESSERTEATLSSRYGLTQREEEVARLLARGKSNQAIARELNISVHTARHHTQRVLTKLKVHSRGEAGAKIRG
jgi:DNA-binding NarL/FixJ family response regulator